MKSEQPIILIIDDDPAIRTVLAKMIHKLRDDVTIVFAADCMEAIDKVGKRFWKRRVRPLITLVDARLPVMDGFKCAEMLKEQKMKNIVMMSAFLDRDLVPRAVSSGVDTVFKKSMGPKGIASAIVSMLEALEATDE